MLDAILIPGGGVTQNGDLYPWVTARFDVALAHDHETQFYIPLSRGTVYKPSSYIESEIGKQYLISRGVIPDRILTETTSLDTIGNLYFARVQFTDPRHLSRLHIINSSFHLPRTQAIAKWVFQLTPLSFPYHLTFEASSDDSMPHEIRTARIEKETQSLENVQQLASTITDLPAFKTWLYSDHTAYNQKGTGDMSLDPLLANSY